MQALRLQEWSIKGKQEDPGMADLNARGEWVSTLPTEQEVDADTQEMGCNGQRRSR